ncbi:zinc ribbon domain-containing protein [Acidianus sp. HS-5]|uniref:zinc ribbon domain-containing protein n=1 Tax=Acidianus sp. HS-5 TaxID=2886040 RepID=UPI001F2F938D|nr:zinc ribbon domain-containing protein [Acidianus sp. HS-5]BDC17565.1 hypothetical protein HS5_04550 [Acidianus sp. HS-5]
MVKYCPRCGYPNVDDAKFCMRCGYPFQQPPPNTPPPTTPQPLYVPPQRPYTRTKRKSKKKVGIPIGAIIVAIIAILAVISSLYRSAELITPSEAASVLGGSWGVNDDHSYSFVVNSNGSITVKYLSGSTKTYPLSSCTVCLLSLTEPLPQNGYVECLDGTVNGNSEKIHTVDYDYSQPCVAQAIFCRVYFRIPRGSSITNVSSSEVIVYSQTCCETISSIIELSGNSIYGVSVIGQQQVEASQLEKLISYL